MKNNNLIISVGSVALDSLIINNKHYNKILGGSATYFSIIASLYSKVYISAIVGNDFPNQHLKLLKSKNINFDYFSIERGRTFRWGGEYSQNLHRRTTHFTELGVFETFNPQFASGKEFKGILFLGNIQPQLQLSALRQLPNANIVITDTMNLWIDLNKELLYKVIKKSNIFMLNDEEAEQLTNTSEIKKSAKILLSKGPSCVIIKQGAKGCLLSTKKYNIHIPIFDEIISKDPTGAGDSFAGGFTGYLSKYDVNNLIEAAIHGAAAASFTVSEIGINGIKNIDIDLIQQRCNVIQNKMEILV